MSQELETRLHDFGKRVRDFSLKLKWDVINVEYIRQVISASGSVGGQLYRSLRRFGKIR